MGPDRAPATLVSTAFACWVTACSPCVLLRYCDGLAGAHLAQRSQKGRRRRFQLGLKGTVPSIQEPSQRQDTLAPPMAAVQAFPRYWHVVRLVRSILKGQRAQEATHDGCLPTRQPWGPLYPSVVQRRPLGSTPPDCSRLMLTAGRMDAGNSDLLGSFYNVSGQRLDFPFGQLAGVSGHGTHSLANGVADLLKGGL